MLDDRFLDKIDDLVYETEDCYLSRAYKAYLRRPTPKSQQSLEDETLYIFFKNENVDNILDKKKIKELQTYINKVANYIEQTGDKRALKQYQEFYNKRTIGNLRELTESTNHIEKYVFDHVKAGFKAAGSGLINKYKVGNSLSKLKSILSELYRYKAEFATTDKLNINQRYYVFTPLHSLVEYIDKLSAYFDSTHSSHGLEKVDDVTYDFKGNYDDNLQTYFNYIQELETSFNGLKEMASKNELKKIFREYERMILDSFATVDMKRPEHKNLDGNVKVTLHECNNSINSCNFKNLNEILSYIISVTDLGITDNETFETLREKIEAHLTSFKQGHQNVSNNFVVQLQQFNESVVSFNNNLSMVKSKWTIDEQDYNRVSQSLLAVENLEKELNALYLTDLERNPNNTNLRQMFEKVSIDYSKVVDSFNKFDQKYKNQGTKNEGFFKRTFRKLRGEKPTGKFTPMTQQDTPTSIEHDLQQGSDTEYVPLEGNPDEDDVDWSFMHQGETSQVSDATSQVSDA